MVCYDVRRRDLLRRTEHDLKVLMTGGAGYIGCVTIPLLLEHGYHVRVLDNLMYGGTQLLPFFNHPRFEFQRGDLRNPPDVCEAAKGCDAIIHLAAIVGFPACRKHPQLAQEVNVTGTQNVARVAGRSTPVLFGSTGSNYGALVDEICTEETPLNPLSLYAKTKTMAEEYLMEHCNTVAYRFATAFGLSPRLRLDLLVNDFVYAAVKVRHLVVYEKNFMRTFIHVRDIACAWLFALEHLDQMLGQVYNVGSETMNYSKEQICEMIRQRVEFYLHYADVGNDADQRNYVVSYRKICALGYQTTITVEQGIDELIRGLQVIEIQLPFSNA